VAETPETLFLDACVLVPALVRGIVLGAAERDVFRPVWSPRVLDEWRLAAARRDGAAAEDAVLAIQAAMAARFPGACVVPDAEVAAALRLPDPGDAHVVAGTMAAGAGAILTYNLRDFPRRALAPLGLEARHPDGTFWAWLSEWPEAMGAAVAAALAALDIAPDRARAALKRAHLGRFAKAWEAVNPPGRPVAPQNDRPG